VLVIVLLIAMSGLTWACR